MADPCRHCAERIAWLETKLVCAQDLLDYERTQRAAEREAHLAAMELVARWETIRDTMERGG